MHFTLGFGVTPLHSNWHAKFNVWLSGACWRVGRVGPQRCAHVQWNPQAKKRLCCAWTARHFPRVSCPEVSRHSHPQHLWHFLCMHEIRPRLKRCWITKASRNATPFTASRNFEHCRDILYTPSRTSSTNEIAEYVWMQYTLYTFLFLPMIKHISKLYEPVPSCSRSIPSPQVRHSFQIYSTVTCWMKELIITEWTRYLWIETANNVDYYG